MSQPSLPAAAQLRITSPRAAQEYLVPRLAYGFGILLLNAKGELLDDQKLPVHMQDAATVSPREVMRRAMLGQATAVILYQRSGEDDGRPYPEDQKLTRRLRAAGESVGIPLADHIIIGVEKCHSFRAAEGWDRVSS